MAPGFVSMVVPHWPAGGGGRQLYIIHFLLILLLVALLNYLDENGRSHLYGSREGTIQKYFANPKKYFKSQYFSQITVEKFDRSKKLLQILRKFVDPQITFSIIRK